MKASLLSIAMLGLLATPAQAGTQVFDIGFHVQTIHPTNIVVGYKLTCYNNHHSNTTAERFEAQAPLTSTVSENIYHPTHCHLRIVAWDSPPHVHPHDWPAPVVTTWITTL